MTDYTDAILEIHHLYHDGKYAIVLKKCEALINDSHTPRSIKAQAIRRKGDCTRKLYGPAKSLPLYEEAIDLLSTKDEALIWTLESKASALMELRRFDEAIEVVNQAVLLTKDPLDLDHLHDVAMEILDHMENVRTMDKIDHQRKQIINQIDHQYSDLKNQQNKEELETLLQHVPKLEA